MRACQMKSHKGGLDSSYWWVLQSTLGFLLFSLSSSLTCQATYGIPDERTPPASVLSVLTTMTHCLPLASSYFQGWFSVTMTHNDSCHLLCSTVPLPHISMYGPYSMHSSIPHPHAPSTNTQIAVTKVSDFNTTPMRGVIISREGRQKSMWVSFIPDAWFFGGA